MDSKIDIYYKLASSCHVSCMVYCNEWKVKMRQLTIHLVNVDLMARIAQCHVLMCDPQEVISFYSNSGLYLGVVS